MDIRFDDKLCLTPRLIDARGRDAGRVEGVLETRGAAGATCRFVDAVDHDGEMCRYRLVGGGHDGRWLVEDASAAYRPFSRLVVDRLRTLPRDRLPPLHPFPADAPGAPLRSGPIEGPCTLSVIDACVGPGDGLWLRVAIREGVSTARAEGDRAGDGHPEGWLRLADVGPVASVPPRPERSVTARTPSTPCPIFRAETAPRRRREARVRARPRGAPAGDEVSLSSGG